MAPYMNSEGDGTLNHVIEPVEKKPVADDFMYDFKYNHALPTIDVLGINIPEDTDAQKEAEGIVSRLADVLGRGDAEGFTSMFLEYGTSHSRLAFLTHTLYMYVRLCVANTLPRRLA